MKDGQFLLLQKLFPVVAATILAHSAAYASSCESNSSSGRDKHRTSPLSTPSKNRSGKVVDKRSGRKKGASKLRYAGRKSPPRHAVSGEEDDLMVTVDISDDDIRMRGFPTKQSTTADPGAPPVSSQLVGGMGLSSAASSAEITAAVGKSLSAAFTGLKRNFYNITASTSYDKVEVCQPAVTTSNTTVVHKERDIPNQLQESFEHINVGVCDVMDETRFLHTSSDSMDSFASDYSKVSKRSCRSHRKGTPSTTKRMKAVANFELDSTVERLPTLMEAVSKTSSQQFIDSVGQDDIFSDSFMNNGSPQRDVERLLSSSWGESEKLMSEDDSETADVRKDLLMVKVAQVPFFRRVSKSEWIAMNEVIINNKEQLHHIANEKDTHESTNDKATNTSAGLVESLFVVASPFRPKGEVDEGTMQQTNVTALTTDSDTSNSDHTLDGTKDTTPKDCKDVPTADSSVLRPLPRKEDSPEKELVFETKITSLQSQQEDMMISVVVASAYNENVDDQHLDSRNSSLSIDTQLSDTSKCKQISNYSRVSSPCAITTKSNCELAQQLVAAEEHSGSVRCDSDSNDDDGDDELSLQCAKDSLSKADKRHNRDDADDINDVLLGSFSTISHHMDTPQYAFSSSLFTISPPEDEVEPSRVPVNSQQAKSKTDLTNLPTQMHTSLMASDFQYIDLKEYVDSEVDSKSQRSISPLSDTQFSCEPVVQTFHHSAEKFNVPLSPDISSNDRQRATPKSTHPVSHRSHEDFQYFGIMSVSDVAALSSKEVMNATADTVKTAVVSPSDSCSNTELSSENQMHHLTSSQKSFRNDSIFHCVTFSPPPSANERSMLFTPDKQSEFSYWQKENLEKSGLVEVMIDKNDCFDRSTIRKVSVSSPPLLENVAEESEGNWSSSTITAVPMVEKKIINNQIITASLSPEMMDVSMSRQGVSVEFSPVKNDVSFYYTVFDPNKFEKSIDEFSVNEMYENTIIECQSSNDSEIIFGFAEIYSANDMSPVLKKYPSSFAAESEVTQDKRETTHHAGRFETDLVVSDLKEDASLIQPLGYEVVDVKTDCMDVSTSVVDPTAGYFLSRSGEDGTLVVSRVLETIATPQSIPVCVELEVEISKDIKDLISIMAQATFTISKTEESVSAEKIDFTREMMNTSLVHSSLESVLKNSQSLKVGVDENEFIMPAIVDNVDAVQASTVSESSMAEKEATVAFSIEHSALPLSTSHSIVTSEVSKPSIISENQISSLENTGTSSTIDVIAASSPNFQIASPVVAPVDVPLRVVNTTPTVTLKSKISTPQSTSACGVEGHHASPATYLTLEKEIMGKEELSVSCINLDESNCLETMEINIHSDNIAENDIHLSFSDENEKFGSTIEVTESHSAAPSSPKPTQTMTSTTSLASPTAKKAVSVDFLSPKRSASSPMKLVKKPKGGDKIQAVKNNNYYTISTDVHTTSFNGTASSAADTSSELKRVTDIIDLLSTVQAAAITATQSSDHIKSALNISTAVDSTMPSATGEPAALEVNSFGSNVSVQVHKIESRIFCDQLIEAESASTVEPRVQTDGHVKSSVHSGRSKSSTNIRKIMLPRGPTMKTNRNVLSSGGMSLQEKKQSKYSASNIEVNSTPQKRTTFATKATNTALSSPSISSLSSQRTKGSAYEELPMIVPPRSSNTREGTINGYMKTATAKEIMAIKAIGIQTDTVGVESVNTGSTSGRRSSEDSSASSHRHNLTSIRKASTDKHGESTFGVRKIAVYICIIIVAISSVLLQLLPVNDVMVDEAYPTSNFTENVIAPPTTFSPNTTESSKMFQYVRVIAMRQPKVLKRSLVRNSVVERSSPEIFNGTGESIIESLSKFDKAGSLPRPKPFLSLQNKRQYYSELEDTSNETVTQELEVSAEPDGGEEPVISEDVDNTTSPGNEETSYPFQIVYSIATGDFVTLEVSSASSDMRFLSSQEEHVVNDDSDSSVVNDLVLGSKPPVVVEDNLIGTESSDPPVDLVTFASEVDSQNLTKFSDCVEIFRSQLTTIQLLSCDGESGGVKKKDNVKAIIISYSPQVIKELIQNLIEGSKTYLKLGHVQFRSTLKNIIVHFTGMPKEHSKILLDW